MNLTISALASRRIITSAGRSLSTGLGKFPDVISVRGRNNETLTFEKKNPWSVLDQRTFSETTKLDFYKLASQKSSGEHRPAFVVLGESVAINISDGYVPVDNVSFYLDFENLPFQSLKTAFQQTSLEFVQIAPGKIEETIKKNRIDSIMGDLEKAGMQFVARGVKGDVKKALEVLDSRLKDERLKLEPSAKMGAKLLIQIPSKELLPLGLWLEHHYRRDTNSKGLMQSVVSPYGRFSITFSSDVLPSAEEFVRDVSDCYDELYSLLNTDPSTLGMHEVVDIFSQHIPCASFNYTKLT